MTGEVPLRRIEVSGLTSIGHAQLDLSSPVTLLVGPNGAGKSNVVDAFEMLGRVIDRQLNEHLIRNGGFAAILHRPTDPALTPEAIELEVWGDWQGDASNGYKVVIEPAPDDTALVHETTRFHDRSKYSRPYDDALAAARESRLRAAATDDAKAAYVLRVVSGCRVFHFDDTSADAPPKRRIDTADNLTLAPDAQNIAPVLRRLRTDDPSRYQRIVRTVRTVAPYFDDFVLEQEGGAIRLRWRERGLDSVFSAGNLSDGTLRFVCLAVLLLQDNAPGTIVLDEPELGLHPFAIHQLAALLRRAAQDRRVVAATQSVTLLEQFSVEEVAIVERTSAGTKIQRPDPGELQQWLSEYSLGELWEKNLLGGRPRPDDSPRVVRG
ncbi:AAA family ATPase [Kribbella solani]|uniref:AAA family ATPase n=1 Tax=Kribbella solani TaxID=236067 RepID=UPI0029B2EFBE|nr:AAA family ATPase [Kribbella solani]MDX2971607.1 AAA family ATPase [Kribbella solani]MDX3000683.1 AAA family ATPase [Kribbella solani]